MAVGDRYLIKDFQTYAGEQCVNVYGYRQLLGEANAGQLAATFDDSVLQWLVSIQQETVKHDRIEVINLDDPLDWAIHTDIINDTGTVLGEGMPPFVCWSFMFRRVSRETRNGWKRIVGVSEPDQVGGVRTEGAAGRLNSVAAVMFVTLELEVPLSQWAPVILRREVTGEPPNTVVTWRDFPVAGVDYRHIGTQNTRKLGRGI